MSTDDELYQAWTQGDRRSGEKLIARYLPVVARFFANKSSASSDLEDLTGATFERCAARLGGFRGEGTFRAYILAISSNVFVDHLRQRYASPEFDDCSLVDLAPSPSAVVARLAETRLLLRALRNLPIPLQMVLELHFFEEVSRGEAAQILDLAPGTVASRLRRAKRELAVQIQALADTPSLAASTVTDLQTWVCRLRTTMGLRAVTPAGGKV